MEKIAIHTKTQEEFNKVLEIFEKKGWVWRSWNKPTSFKENWKDFEKETALYYNNEFCYINKKFSEKWFDKIISFEEFLKLENKEEQTQEEFTPWEQVAVSDKSIEDALERNWINSWKEYYIWIAKNWEYVTEDKDWCTSTWKFIAKIPTRKERKLECTNEEWEKIKSILNLK